MIPSEAAFQAFGKVRSAAMLMADISSEHPELAKLACELIMSSVVEIVAFALKDEGIQAHA